MAWRPAGSSWGQEDGVYLMTPPTDYWNEYPIWNLNDGMLPLINTPGSGKGLLEAVFGGGLDSTIKSYLPIIGGLVILFLIVKKK